MSHRMMPSVASNEPRRAEFAHYLLDGRALCGRLGMPEEWPNGECWSPVPRVTEPDPPGICSDCSGARRDGYRAPGCVPRWYPWRDPYGRVHAEVPRCVGGTKPRGFGRTRRGGDCQRKGVVQRGLCGGREGWYCLQHDPARRDERRVAELAPIFMALLREAVELMPRTKRASDWRRRVDAALAKVVKRDA